MYNLLSHTVTGQSIRKAIDERVSYDDIRKGVTPVEGKRELNISDLDVNSPDPPVQEDLEHEFGTPLRYKEAEIKKMLTKKFVESLQNRMATIVDERNWMLLNDYNTKEIKVRYRIPATMRPLDHLFQRFFIWIWFVHAGETALSWLLRKAFHWFDLLHKEILVKEYSREEHKTFIANNGDLIKRLLVKIFLNRVAKAARRIIQEYSIVTGHLTGEQVQEELERKYLVPMNTYRNFLNLLCAHPNSQVDELIDLNSEMKVRARRTERQEQEDSTGCSIM